MKGRAETRQRWNPILSFAVGLLAVGAMVNPAAVSAQARALTVDDLGLDVGVSAPQLSPDGGSVLVVTSRPDYEENRFVRQLVLVDVASGAETELTPQRVAVSGPRWSPSGAEIAFADSASDGEQDQIFILPMGGGEARQITRVERGIGTFEWSNDGAHFLYTTTDAPEERHGEERHNRSFEVGYNSYLTQQAPTSSHLWRIPVGGGDAERLTEGAESVGNFVVSPDGHTVALSVQPRPHTGERNRSIIRLLDLGLGEFRNLPLDAPVYPGSFSPDGGALSFVRSRGPEPGFNPSGVFVQSLDGGNPVDVTAEIDRSLGGAAWLSNSQSLLVRGTGPLSGSTWGKSTPDLRL